MKCIGAAGEDVVDFRQFWSRSQRSRLQAESRPMSPPDKPRLPQERPEGPSGCHEPV